MKEWFRPADFAAAAGCALPADIDAMSRYALAQGWRDDPRRARQAEGQAGGWEYHYSLAPAEVQARLLTGQTPAQGVVDNKLSGLWQVFERLPKAAQAEAAERLAAVELIDSLARSVGRSAAVAQVAQLRGVSRSTLFGWLTLADGVARADRLAALAPRRSGRTATAECDPRAWDFLLADYLRPEQPNFEACDRRMREAAAEHGWAPIPSAKTLKRRLEKEVPAETMTLARKGADALRRLYPAQQRDRSVFGPLQAVNIDGHKLDVLVKLDDTVSRPILVGIQDLATGLIVGWNLDWSETRESVRLAIADMVEEYGIPEEIYLDNGRGFASKLISGGQKTRFRFKIKVDEPSGILTQLGVKCHWTTPYSGQSKPIERAWRDLVEEVARHPLCAGAYTGSNPTLKPSNYGEKAMEFDALESLIAQQIERHNTRQGRRGLGMNGRSFLQAWNDAMAAGAMVQRGTPEQRRMLLLASEAVMVRRDQPMIHFAGNRYWHDRMANLAGEKVILRFDPRALHEPIAVYAIDGRFVGLADCLEMAGFADLDKAREHGKARRAWVKAATRQAELLRRLSVEDLAAQMPAPAPMKPVEQPRVIRMVANGRPVPDETSPQAFGDAFAAGLRSLHDSGEGAAILPFRPES